MILVLGSSSDKVFPQLVGAIRDSGEALAVVDEDRPERFAVRRVEADGRPRFHVEGDACSGGRPVGAIFVRHAVARTLDPRFLRRLGTLQTDLNGMLRAADCPVINPPDNAFSNYSKPYQLALLAAAGFTIPRSLVTNVPAEAWRFIDACAERVIFKGASNVMTFAQRFRPEHHERIALLPNCPTLFQEYVEGPDYRVHVVGEEAFVTRLAASNEDYRRSALRDGEEIVAEAADLPPEILERCIRFTAELGLVVSGIDFKGRSEGEPVVLECNPYPQFTFYAGRSKQPIMQAVVGWLQRNQREDPNVYA